MPEAPALAKSFCSTCGRLKPCEHRSAEDMRPEVEAWKELLSSAGTDAGVDQLDHVARGLAWLGAPGWAFEELRKRGWTSLSERGVVWCETCNRAAKPTGRRDQFGRVVGRGHFDGGHQRERI